MSIDSECYALDGELKDTLDHATGVKSVENGCSIAVDFRGKGLLVFLNSTNGVNIPAACRMVTRDLFVACRLGRLIYPENSAYFKMGLCINERISFCEGAKTTCRVGKEISRLQR